MKNMKVRALLFTLIFAASVGTFVTPVHAAETQVWVVDKEEWTEDVAKLVSYYVCSGCGAKFKTPDAISDHMLNAILADDDTNCDSNRVDDVLEHTYVEHPEEGHWETVTTPDEDTKTDDTTGGQTSDAGTTASANTMTESDTKTDTTGATTDSAGTKLNAVASESKAKSGSTSAKIETTSGNKITAKTVTVKTGTTTVSLNLRSGAGTSNKKLVTMPKGTACTIVGEKKVNGSTWYQLTTKVNGKSYTGYASSKYIKVKTATTTVQSTAASVISSTTAKAISTGKTAAYKVTASSLTIRKGPGTRYAVLGKCKKNVSVSVISITKGWAKISYKGTAGYVAVKYLKKSV